MKSSGTRVESTQPLNEVDMSEKKEEKKEVKKHPSFIERKLKVINEMENKALARYLAERLKKR